MKKAQILGGIQLIRLTANKIVERKPRLWAKRLSELIVRRNGSLESKRRSKLKVETSEQKLEKVFFLIFEDFIKRHMER